MVVGVASYQYLRERLRVPGSINAVLNYCWFLSQCESFQLPSSPLMRGGSSVVFLTYFRPTALLKDQSLLRQKIVCEDSVEFGKSGSTSTTLPGCHNVNSQQVRALWPSSSVQHAGLIQGVL